MTCLAIGNMKQKYYEGLIIFSPKNRSKLDSQKSCNKIQKQKKIDLYLYCFIIHSIMCCRQFKFKLSIITIL